MKTTSLTVLMALAVVMMVAGGCGRTKVTFVNLTDKTVATEFVTQGTGRVNVGDIAPGKKEKQCLKFDPELLPAQFSITIDGGTPETLTRVVMIPKEPPSKLRVHIKPDMDLGRIIEVTDADGTQIPTK